MTPFPLPIFYPFPDTPAPVAQAPAFPLTLQVWGPEQDLFFSQQLPRSLATITILVNNDPSLRITIHLLIQTQP
jgi:hypothetical protein